MTTTKLEINRPLTGILALALLLVGAFVAFGLKRNDQFAAALIRSGLVLGALWLALPTKNRPAAWENLPWTGFLIAMLVVVVFLTSRLRWWAFPLVIGAMFGVYFARRVWRRS